MQGYNISDLSRKTQELIKQNNLDTNQDGRINDENGELAELLSKTGKQNINELLFDNWWNAKSLDVIGGGALGTVIAGKGLALFLESSNDKSFSAIRKSALKIFAQKNPNMPIPVSEDVPRILVSPDADAMEQLRKLDEAIGGDTYEYALKRGKVLQASLDEERLKEIARRKAHNEMCANWKPKYSMDKVFKNIRKGFIKTNMLKGAGIGSVLVGAALAIYFIARKPQHTIQMQGDSA